MLDVINLQPTATVKNKRIYGGSCSYGCTIAM